MLLLVKAKLAPNVCSRLAKSITVLPSDALRDGMIDSTYSTTGNLEQKISEISNLNAGLGVHRLAMKMNKIAQYKSLIATCRSFKYSPSELEYRIKSYKWLQKIVAAKNAAKKLKQA